MTTYNTLSLDDMSAVIGGTFTSNEFPEWVYQKAGFTTNYHFFARDEFIYNGVTMHEDEANRIMKALGWEKVWDLSGQVKCFHIEYKGHFITRDTPVPAV